MLHRIGACRLVVSLAIASCFSCAGHGSALAAVISATPALPLLGVQYSSATGLGCFPTAGFCIKASSLTFTALSSDTFDQFGEHLTMQASYAGALTDGADDALGSVLLTGSIEEEVLGRTFSIETGSWNTKLQSLALNGPVLGHTLTLGLGASDSIGTDSIDPIGDGTFRIDSFFDVFVDLVFDANTPLHDTRGPVLLTLPSTPVPTPVPAPAGLTLLAAPLLFLSWAHWRRQGKLTRPHA
jgi:hypothetical protein